eukprot:8178288-Ditylum_brightwellii.AAC.1
MDDFDHNVKKFNTWFSDKRNLIVKEVNEDGYTKYLRCLFKTYLMAVDPKFLGAVTLEQRLWLMGRQADSYEYADLMQFTLTLFNNHTTLSKWKGEKGQLTNKKGSATDDPKFLAPLTDIQMAIKGGNNSNNLGSSGGGASRAGGGAGDRTAEGSGTDKGNGRQSWKFCNPNNAETMERNGRTWKWCKNDCHSKP